MAKKRKMRTVLVYCLNTDSDGTRLNSRGEVAADKRSYLHTWEKQRRGEEWLRQNPKLWKPLP